MSSAPSSRDYQASWAQHRDRSLTSSPSCALGAHKADLGLPSAKRQVAATLRGWMRDPHSCWVTESFTLHLSWGEVPWGLGASRAGWEPNPRVMQALLASPSLPAGNPFCGLALLQGKQSQFGLILCISCSHPPTFSPWKGNSKDLGHFLLHLSHS